MMLNLSAKHLMFAALFTQLLLNSNAVSFPGTVGPYNTSIATTQLIDHHRLDPYAPTPQPRTLMISLFHPVPPAACCPSLTSYMDPITATFEDEQYAQTGIPAGAFGSLTLQTCKPYTNPTSSGRVKGPKFPLVLFSPGLGNTRLLHSVMAQQLSSTGYIVVTVDHPYDAGIVTFPDNTTILAANITTDNQIVDDLNIRVRDVSFVLDQLHRPSVISKLIPGQTCGLDTSKVGIYGHSLGGATAAEAMLSDSRLKGGINLDGSFFGSVINRGLDKPFMIMAHEGKNLTTDVTWGALWPKLKGTRRRFMINGSTHGTFTDLAQAADIVGLREEFPTQAAAFLGSIDGGRALQVIATYTSRFFDFVLKGKKVELLDMSSKEFPEVTVGEN
ncbi:PAF acetylhydrolase family protein [Aspergillus fischeri NRRL 181]|uniref:1-alkyl-2-acetylglycerophosphocholine esterase n=1 Tax=Neosartorya fischeri (strain ATCC 1020 / DSM 3700 / CBS 544.65 / FGSC A1164 / JCM 1740 / NRRL 181 / WB 181) TaxID=331117 RepID=A1DIZ2_NEOFI|nr:PAF acetylhydrolase family protein [Aspergillus fischeri NRRL 181]EAW19349.1 PAF acetylhydrolase family protein [Aspergillus fischeri NRRL 181]